jgi:hypothetical protein
VGISEGGEDCLAKAYAAYARTALTADTRAYYDTRSQIDGSPLKYCEIVPSGAGSVAVLPIKPLRGDGGSMGSVILVCDRERAMSPKEMAWCQSVCSKLYTVCKT